MSVGMPGGDGPTPYRTPAEQRRLDREFLVIVGIYLVGGLAVLALRVLS